MSLQGGGQVSYRSDALAAMRGEEPEHIAFIGRMNLWYNYHKAGGTLPEHYQGWSYWDVVRDLGIGILGFGAWSETFFKKVHHGVDVRQFSENNEEVVEYATPYGVLRQRTAVTDVLRGTVDSGSHVEVLFKDESDYDALHYLIENTEIVENYEEYAKYVDEIGEDGVALPFTGWVPMHELMWRYMGVERFYYELYDRPQRVERLHEAFLDMHREIVQLAAHCPAQAIEVGGNYDDHITPPSFWDTYIAPFYQEVTELFERTGRILVIHGDGNMDKLLPRIADSGVQVVEALTPKPNTTIDVGEVRRMWRDRVCMWGLIPFGILMPTYSEEDFQTYVVNLYRTMAPGDRFILGFGDNVPPEALLTRIQWLANFNATNGSYPIQP